MITARRKIGLFMVLPAIILFLVMTIYPFVYMIYNSFTNLDLAKTGTGQFIGFRNYIDIIHDQLAISSIEFTALMVLIAVPTEMILGLGLSYLIRGLFAEKALRSLFLIPMMVPAAVGGFGWKMLFNFIFGPINYPKYLKLADYFVRARGKGNASSSKYTGITPEYFVDHKPFVELEELTGHAVRMLYLCCGATDVYLETGEKDLWRALEKLWSDLVQKKMHITGGCGSRSEWEAFGKEYELPNKRAYTETCAAIANVMWNYRMFLATGDGKYVDTMEQVLYNGLLSGISLDGKHYFYDNPLESDGTHRRKEWFECACCPPNIARLITSHPGYIYSVSKDESKIFVNMYEKSKSKINTHSGNMAMTMETDYPWSEEVRICLDECQIAKETSICLRIPGWVEDFSIKVNVENVNIIPKNGYIELKRFWKKGDSIELSFSMPVEMVRSHPFVEENRGKAAVKRGPIVYCAEAVDNNFEVRALRLDCEEPRTHAEYSNVADLGKIVWISGRGFAWDMNNWKNKLYVPMRKLEPDKPVEFKLIPYSLWANRNAGPMVVWLRLI